MSRLTSHIDLRLYREIHRTLPLKQKHIHREHNYYKIYGILKAWCVEAVKGGAQLRWRAPPTPSLPPPRPSETERSIVDNICVFWESYRRAWLYQKSVRKKKSHFFIRVGLHKHACLSRNKRLCEDIRVLWQAHTLPFAVHFTFNCSRKLTHIIEVSGS